jgi:hypothetical protein
MDSRLIKRTTACESCTCREFVANPWKEQTCINCFHDHSPINRNSQYKGFTSQKLTKIGTTETQRNVGISKSPVTRSPSNFDRSPSAPSGPRLSYRHGDVELNQTKADKYN